MGAVNYSSVPRLWPDSTIVCLGSGPSLTQADADYCRGKARVIAVNSAIEFAPWADVLYAHDAKWWGWHKGMPSFQGLKFGSEPGAGWPGVQLVKVRRNRVRVGKAMVDLGATGLDDDPGYLRHGHNSGYQAIDLAVHLGAARILLLGYDMQGKHFHAPHPDQSRPPFALCLPCFATLVEPLKARGIEIVNCTRNTAIDCFPRGVITEALSATVSGFSDVGGVSPEDRMLPA